MKTGFFYDTNQRVRFNLVFIIIDMCFFIGKVDNCLHTGEFVQILFDTCRAGSACHPFNWKFNFLED